MTGSEFLALVDERWSDGRWYPTLEDYGRALAEVRRRETPTAPRVRSGQDLRQCDTRAMTMAEYAARQGTSAADHLPSDLWLGPK